MDIFYYLNYEHSQIIKENNEIKWININNYNYTIESTVQDIWINDFVKIQENLLKQKRRII